MTHWYALQPCDESFFTTAPHVYTFVHDLPVPPEQVWDSLVAPQSVAAWTPLLRSIAWTSPRPFGVGTTRTVVLPGRALTIREHFFRWEEGTRFSFYGLEANRPLFHRFAEDYIVEDGPKGSRFTWTFALEGTAKTRLGLKALDPVTALQFRAMAHGATGHFADRGAGSRAARSGAGQSS